ncbi:PaaI family thioesterase [Agrococcus versicolor]
MAGIDYLQAMIDGEIPPPPMISLMDLDLVSVSPGTATFTCQPDESHYNPIGAVHGGYVCTVLDSAAGCAVHTTLPAGVGYTSLEIKVSYLRAVRGTTGPLTAVGTVTKPGSRVAFAEAVVTDSDGRVVATATSTLLVFPIAT